jgi:acyl dehydratase
MNDLAGNSEGESMPSTIAGPTEDGQLLAESTLRARNSAPSSANKIHDDEAAQAMGYRAALVPGNAVYSYAAEAIVAALGPQWADRGGVELRFVRPVHEGDELRVQVRRLDETSDVAVSVLDPAGKTAARGRAWVASESSEAPAAERYPAGEPPTEPPPFHEPLVLDLDHLGSIDESTEPGEIHDYLESIGDDRTDAALVVPSGYVAHMYAPLMSANFRRDTPSVHVSTRLQHYRAVTPGERLSVRGRVESLYGRKGSRYYALDMAWVDESGAVVAVALHTAIYRLRPKGSGRPES